MTAEVVLPRRVKPQPSPALYPAGDCGACVLGGVLDLEVSDVYAKFQRDGKIEPFSHMEIKQACYRAQADGRLDRLITDVPRWPAPDSLIAFGEGSWMRSLEWFQYIRMAIDAGYYALCAVNSEAGGPFHPASTDHFVMLVGARTREDWPEGQKFGRMHQELLVSCSSTSRPSSGWVAVHDFLRDRGGYNAILARPA